eukprot:TRINITY_DN3269_c0_g1_i1.p1 TRINITY_DN3269_c0_g1~~TRINITY_DN3269_c0_g1_i1.p1  ORF type:complete len:797 (+),score=272.40 TRINITY_DN3269_c0_g1_i1:89-2479(+)
MDPGGGENGGSAAARFDAQVEAVTLPSKVTAADDVAPFTFCGSAPRSRFESQEDAVLLPASVRDTAAASPPRPERGNGVVLEKARVHRVLESGDWPAPAEGAGRTVPRRRDPITSPTAAPVDIVTELDAQCRDFVARIGADDAALRALLQLSTEQRQRVLERGPLGGAVKDPSAVLLSRIRNVERESSIAPGGPPICGDYRKHGFCKRGELCRYQHIENDEPPRRPRVAGRGVGRPSRTESMKHVLCKFWAQGRCSKGPACPFSHDGSGACAADDGGADDEASVVTDDADAPAAPPAGAGAPPAVRLPAGPPQWAAPWPPPPPAGPPPPPPPMDGQWGKGGFGKGMPRPQWEPGVGGGKGGPRYPPAYPPYSEYSAAPPAAPMPEMMGVWGPDGGWYPTQPEIPAGAMPHAEDDAAPLTDDEEERARDSKLARLRERLVGVVATLHPNKRPCVSVAFQVVLGDFPDDEREMLLGLEPNAVGLTRFRSVLIKRTLRHAHQAEEINAVQSLSQWEEHLLRWLPPTPRGGVAYTRHFEGHFCNRVLECCRVMLASPFCRLRLPPGSATDAVRESITDPMAQALQVWGPWAAALAARDARDESFPGLDAPPRPPVEAAAAAPVTDDGSFTLTSGVTWTADKHHVWPITFRIRARALLRAAAQTRGRRGPGLLLSDRQCAPRLVGSVLSYLPPVCAADVPGPDRMPGSHEFLDLVGACFANYSLCVLPPAAQDPAAAKQRLGEQMWQHVQDTFGPSHAPKVTGMLLQIEPADLLFDLVNARKFSDALHEAWQVMSEAAAEQ